MTRFLAFVAASRRGLALVVAGAGACAAKEEACWGDIAGDRRRESFGESCGRRGSVESAGIFLDDDCDRGEDEFREDCADAGSQGPKSPLWEASAI